VRLRAAAVAVCVLLGSLPDVASSAGSSAREVAAALRSDPVFVADSERRLLTVPQRGRVRIRIVRRDLGRIQIAVVSPRSAERAGGLGELANAVDHALPGRRGALILTTGSAFHVITSHQAVNPTAAALRAAVESKRAKGLDAQLLAAIDGIAEVDPGPDADLNAPSPAAPSPPDIADPDDTFDDIGDSFRLGVLIVAAAIALPFVFVALALLLGWRRRREAAEDREQIQRGDARQELISLGDEIRALDLDVDMPNASARGREEYERALSLYDRANNLLGKKDPSEVELYEARRSLEEGRSRLAAAREALGAGNGPA
jgi:hypothetical protein